MRNGGLVIRTAGECSTLKAERLVDEDDRDAPGDLLVLDDEDLAALTVRPAASVVVALPGHGTRRAFAELAALLHGGRITNALERRGEIGYHLVHAGDENDLARAEGIAGEPVAAAVDVDDLARQRDRIHTADEPICRNRLPPAARAFITLVGRCDGRAQPVVPFAQRVEQAHVFQGVRAAVHHARALRDSLEHAGKRIAPVRRVDELDAAAGDRNTQFVDHSSFSTGLPPRKRFDQSLSHLSPSSSAIAGSMISCGNWLSGVSTWGLEGTRFTALKNSCPSRDSRNSVKRSAACGRRESLASLIALAWAKAGMSGFQSTGAPAFFSVSILLLYASTKRGISPDATSCAARMWPLRIVG